MKVSRNRVFIISIVLFVFTSCSGNGDGALTNSTNANAPALVPYTAANGTRNTNQPDPFNAADANSATNTNTANRNELKTSIYAARPGPDNSTFTSTMDKTGDFMEVREFKNHPMIVKVERRVLQDRSKYLVYLKNGKTVEAPADKMENFRVMAPGNILEAIGIKAVPESNDGRDANKIKKPE